jgi:dUTP pyrophosphatase
MPNQSGDPELVLRFRKMTELDGWPLPSYGSERAAGLDLSACLPDPGQTLTLAPGSITLIPTGWAVAIPEGYEGQVRPRSGVALRRGLTLINSPGTIDSDYRGEIGLAMVNHGTGAAVVKHGERLAQLVIARVWRPRIEAAAELDATARGAGGFGSTGLAAPAPRDPKGG